MSGTVDLRPLIDKVLRRDTDAGRSWDIDRESVPGACSDGRDQRDAKRPEVSSLRDLYEERAAIREFDGGEDRAEAEAMAWREVASMWYRLHGSRTPADFCAGCGRPIGQASEVLLLPLGERAHADRLRCIQVYGRRWRHQAALALDAIGIPAPPEIAVEASYGIDRGDPHPLGLDGPMDASNRISGPFDRALKETGKHDQVNFRDPRGS
jgi:hypothetical protein